VKDSIPAISLLQWINYVADQPRWIDWFTHGAYC